jgi:inositol oxygenase
MKHKAKILFFFLLAAFHQMLLATESKDKNEYRLFDETSPPHVKKFYQLNHQYQTLDFVLQKKKDYLPPKRMSMSLWEAMRLLDTVIDESDPDLNLPQSYHSYQTAEALRRGGFPRWLVLTGFIHDMGKILTFYGEPQWAVVGDTFPVGCPFSKKIVFPDFFLLNPDTKIVEYQTGTGIYSPGIGFDSLHMSWGHDEYLYHVVKDYLPKQAAYIIRYHSFYAAHCDEAYQELMSAYDKEMMPWLKLFSNYDLYSKTEVPLNMDELKSYYEDLVAEFFPSKINW